MRSAGIRREKKVYSAGVIYICASNERIVNDERISQESSSALPAVSEHSGGYYNVLEIDRLTPHSWHSDPMQLKAYPICPITSLTLCVSLFIIKSSSSVYAASGTREVDTRSASSDRAHGYRLPDPPGPAGSLVRLFRSSEGSTPIGSINVLRLQYPDRALREGPDSFDKFC